MIMMKKLTLCLAMIAMLGSSAVKTMAADPPAPPKPSVEDRLTDLEA